MLVNLSADGLNGAHQPFFRRSVNRHEHGNERVVLQALQVRADMDDCLGCQCIVAVHPIGIIMTAGVWTATLVENAAPSPLSVANFDRDKRVIGIESEINFKAA